jgi:hypothetical protein
MDMKQPRLSGFTLCCILALGFGLSACSRNDPTEIKDDHVGVYTLVSVDGNPVPATVFHDGVTMDVISGVFTINADGTCSSRTVFVPPTGIQITRDASATYTMDGTKLTMQWDGAGVTEGTIVNDMFTLDNEGMILVYMK